MPRILLVEDDPMISEIYERKFSSAGFEVVTAMSGKEVLQKALQQSFDLVLLDMVLPEMSGMEVLAELRKNGAYDPNLKVIIFSNLSEQEDRKKALDLGANGFIPKTEYTPSRLVEEVQRFLRQFSEQRKNLERAANPVSASDASSRKKILLIEDEAVFSDMFGKRLEDEGYEVVCAFDGVSGLKTALERPFDLIITDMMLPGMNGHEIIVRLKAEESTKNVPVFLFSASVSVEELGQAECEGADRCFMKTRITPSELAAEATKVLGGN
jgi:DNA-binding response OmpR family regulator